MQLSPLPQARGGSEQAWRRKPKLHRGESRGQSGDARVLQQKSKKTNTKSERRAWVAGSPSAGSLSSAAAASSLLLTTAAARSSASRCAAAAAACLAASSSAAAFAAASCSRCRASACSRRLRSSSRDCW